MNFVQFAHAHGLIVHEVVAHRWVRTRTQDKPHHRNGAYKYLGDRGWVQNHATMTEPAMWQADSFEVAQIDMVALKAAQEREMARLSAARAKAAEKAQWILSQAKPAGHLYLEQKGFPGAHGLVWKTEGEALLVIPMRVAGKVVGCQLIDEAGNKKFLTGQQTKGTAFVLGQGEPVYCEGFATGLSVQAALKAARMTRSVVVCFSAGNLAHLAKSGAVVADNDVSKTGERVAQETGLPYFLPPVVGFDFNDWMSEVGTFKAAMALKVALMR